MKVILVIIVAMLILGCTGGPRAEDFEKYVGSEGITIEFTENFPPKNVYEDAWLPVKLNVRNEGAIDVLHEDMLLTFSSDPLYITGGLSGQDGSKYDTSYDPQKQNMIKGRSLGFPGGEMKFFSIPSTAQFKTKRIIGQREKPSTQITASLCYEYTTVLTTEVCIDTDTYGDNQREQVCVGEDLTLSGQGAPIAITHVEVKSFPVVDDLTGNEAVRPSFLMTIENVGAGRLVGPAELSLEKACLLKDIPKEQVSAVKVEASLLGTQLECQPDEHIKLFEGEGQVRCIVPLNDLANPVYSAKQNFQTVLMVNLTYLYKASATAELEIERTIPVDDLPIEGPAKGYIVVGNQIERDANDNPVTLCAHYSKRPESAPGEVRGIPISSFIDGNFTCSCGIDRCLRLVSKDPPNCITGSYCPGSTYCCK